MEKTSHGFIKRMWIFFFLLLHKKKPYVAAFGSDVFSITKYEPFGLTRLDFKESKKGEPAIRFHLKGQRGSFVEWLSLSTGEKKTSLSLGPAEVLLTKDLSLKNSKKNQLIFYAKGNQIFYSLKNKIKRLFIGKAFPTGWMDFEMRVLEFFPKTEREIVFVPQESSSEETISAVYVSYNQKGVWLVRGSFVQFYEKNHMYALGYLNKKQKLNFSLKLLDFQMETHSGSERAKSYESHVEIDGQKHVISMNEPLKKGGYTFYQSGFERDKKGGATVSILSVNKDLGRFVKYFGSALVSLGMILLFYRRKKLFNQKI